MVRQAEFFGRVVPALFLLILCAAQASVARAAATEFIHVAASLPLSGPQAERGDGIREGLAVAVRELNERGGVGGRQVRLEILDDAGDSVSAGRNIARLASDKRVAAIVGCFGEASCLSAAREARKARLPLLGAIVAGSAVCESGGPAYCLHASHADEAEAIATQVGTLGLQGVVLLISPTLVGYGAPLGEVFMRRGLTSAVLSVPEDPSGASEVFRKAVRMTQKDPRLAVAMLLESDAAVAATLALRQANPGVQIAGFSTIEPYRWLQRTQQWAKGIMVAHSIPDPDLPSLAITKQYQRAMERYAQRSFAFSHEQLEAFMSIRLLESVTKPLTGGELRHKFYVALERQGAIDIDGHLLQFADRRRLGAVKIHLYVVGKHGGFIE